MEYNGDFNGLFRGGILNGHEYVDLGLSVKWATCNLGASSPADYGCYFAWGEIKPKFEYEKKNCASYDKVKILGIAGRPQHDAARANWGGRWRLPTEAEIREMESKCKWQWTTLSGVNGYKISGATGSSIFLPAAGKREGQWLLDDGKEGYYWSGTPSIDEWEDGSICIRINDYNYRCYSNFRHFGQTIRPVFK